jgi:hypothetical protein
MPSLYNRSTGPRQLPCTSLSLPTASMIELAQNEAQGLDCWDEEEEEEIYMASVDGATHLMILEYCEDWGEWLEFHCPCSSQDRRA